MVSFILPVSTLSFFVCFVFLCCLFFCCHVSFSFESGWDFLLNFHDSFSYRFTDYEPGFNLTFGWGQELLPAVASCCQSTQQVSHYQQEGACSIWRSGDVWGITCKPCSRFKNRELCWMQNAGMSFRESQVTNKIPQNEASTSARFGFRNGQGGTTTTKFRWQAWKP